MTRKPTFGLPDVFAKPGGAPARGTAIEDLPDHAADPAADAASHDWLATEPVGAAFGATATPAPPPPPPPAAPYQAATAPSRKPAAKSAPRARLAGVPRIVWFILLASLTAPLWESSLLSGIGISTPDQRIEARGIEAQRQQDVRIGALEQRLVSATTQIDALRADVALVSQHAIQANTEARAMALLRLADVLRGAGPFNAELAVLRATGGDAGALRPVLAQLAPYAATGAPTPDQLLREMRILNDSMARSYRQANPRSWMDVINWTGLNGTQPAVQIDPSIRAAQLGLSRVTVGDIAGAIEQASMVDGAYQTDFADWVTEAKARVAADAALREIGSQIARPSTTP